MNKIIKDETTNNWHECTADAALQILKTTVNGLSQMEAVARLKTHGPNRLPEAAKRSALIRFFLHFHNILISP